MSKNATFEAEVNSYYLASDAARLATLIVRVSRNASPIYVDSARKTIEAMRATLNKIEGILETEEESNV